MQEKEIEQLKKQLQHLQQENQTLNTEINNLKSCKKFGLVWEQKEEFFVKEINENTIIFKDYFYNKRTDLILTKKGTNSYYINKNQIVYKKVKDIEISYCKRMVPKFKKINGRLPLDNDVIDTLEPNYLRDVINVPAFRSSDFLKQFGFLFDYPKPHNLIKILLNLHTNKNSIILDFFSGSGTTGHAVQQLNKEDGGNRQYIMCTNNENGICENITYERMKRINDPESFGLDTKKVEPLPHNLKYLKIEHRTKMSATTNNKTIEKLFINREGK